MKKNKLVILSVMTLVSLTGCNNAKAKKNEIDLTTEAGQAKFTEKITAAMEGAKSLNSIGIESSFSSYANADVSGYKFQKDGRESKGSVALTTAFKLNAEVDGLFGKAGDLYAHARIFDNKETLKVNATIRDCSLFKQYDEEGNIIYKDEAHEIPALRDIDANYSAEISGNTAELYLSNCMLYGDLSKFGNEKSINSIQRLLNNVWKDFKYEASGIFKTEEAPNVSEYAGMISGDEAKYCIDVGIEANKKLLDEPNEEDIQYAVKDILDQVKAEDYSEGTGQFINFYEYSNGDFEVKASINSAQVIALVPSESDVELTKAEGCAAIKFDGKGMLKEIAVKADAAATYVLKTKKHGDSTFNVAAGIDLSAKVKTGIEVNRVTTFEGYTDITSLFEEKTFE